MNSQQVYGNRPYAPKSHRALKIFVRFCLVLILALGILFIRHLVSPAQARAGNSEVLSAQATKPTLSLAQAVTMASTINQAIQNYPSLDIGVSIVDLNNNKQYNYGEQAPFIAASVSKVLTACAFLHQVETGQSSLSQDIEGTSASTLLQNMIVNSDNDAWADFENYLTLQGLSDYAKSVGVTNYDAEQNTQTVVGVSTLLTKLYEHKILNDSDTQLLLSYMKQADETDYIVASIPAGVNVYHKAGWLNDRVHDAAIIDNGKHPYVLVIFSKTVDGSDYPASEGMQMYANVTKATLQAFVNS